MNYINYKTAVVQKLHVQLLGWPDAIPFVNPHQITTVAAINALRHALTVATCKWVVLTKRQQREYRAAMAKDFEDGLVVSKKRKVRADKGKKRKAVAPTDGDEEEEESEGSQSDETDDDETAAPPPPKKRRVLPKASSSKTTKAPAAKPKVRKAVKTAAKKTKGIKTAVKKTKGVASRLPPTAPKSKEFIDSSEESD
jgi:hypothetical protein